jgi:hypothetical protein
MGILLLIASAMVPGPAGATLYEYTYTGPEFDEFLGGYPHPAIGTHVIVKFSIDGLLTGPTTISNFIIMSPPSVCQSSQANVIISRIEEVQDGLPTQWNFIVDCSDVTEYQYMRIDTYGSKEGTVWDSIVIEDPSIGVGFVKAQYRDGVLPAGRGWTVVPAPCAALLLGSGLIPLAWFRCRKRFRK